MSDAILSSEGLSTMYWPLSAPMAKHALLRLNTNTGEGRNSWQSSPRNDQSSASRHTNPTSLDRKSVV